MLRIQEYLRAGNSLKDLSEQYAIKVKEHEDLVLLKFSQIDSPRDDPMVNYDVGIAQQKIDGSLITLYWDKMTNQWRVNTSGTLDADCQVEIAGISFADLFHETTVKYQFFWPNLDPKKVYIFELTSPENRDVTRYEERSLHLLSIRDANTFEELSLEDVQCEAGILDVPMPEIYSFGKDMYSVQKMATDLPALEEGYVVVDYTERDVDGLSWKRVKVKNPAYVALHHMKETSASSRNALMQVVMKGESEEFLSYFPEYKPYVDEIKEAYDKYMSKIQDDWDNLFNLKYLDRKDFAKMATQSVNPSIMFKMYDGKVSSVKNAIDQDVMQKGQKRVAKDLLEKIKIKDDDLFGKEM